MKKLISVLLFFSGLNCFATENNNLEIARIKELEEKLKKGDPTWTVDWDRLALDKQERGTFDKSNSKTDLDVLQKIRKIAQDRSDRIEKYTYKGYKSRKVYGVAKGLGAGGLGLALLTWPFFYSPRLGYERKNPYKSDYHKSGYQYDTYKLFDHQFPIYDCNREYCDKLEKQAIQSFIFGSILFCYGVKKGFGFTDFKKLKNAEEILKNKQRDAKMTASYWDKNRLYTVEDGKIEFYKTDGTKK